MQRTCQEQQVFDAVAVPAFGRPLRTRVDAADAKVALHDLSSIIGCISPAIWLFVYALSRRSAVDSMWRKVNHFWLAALLRLMAAALVLSVNAAPPQKKQETIAQRNCRLRSLLDPECAAGWAREQRVFAKVAQRSGLQQIPLLPQ